MAKTDKICDVWEKKGEIHREKNSGTSDALIGLVIGSIVLLLILAACGG